MPIIYHRPLPWLAATLVLAACGGGGSSPTQVNSVVDVEIQPAVTTLKAGQVQQFHAVALDANHDSLPISDFQWSATPGAIASVSASGAVTVAGVGPFMLTASANGATGRDSILATVDSIHISPSPDTVEADSGTSQLHAQGFGVTGVVVANLTDSSFSWTSTGPTTATVSARGAVIGLQNGGPVRITASLPAALGGGQGTAQVVVVSRVAFVAVAPAVDTTTVADTVTFTATLKDAFGNPLSGPVSRWTSSDTTIAVIDPVTGQALIKATGSATITATSEGKQGTATIYGRVPWKVLSAGSEFVCGVTTGNIAYCWGINGDNQLGIGTNTGPQTCNGIGCSLTPMAVAAPIGASALAFKSVSAGFAGGCGITFDSRAVYCWGDAITGFLTGSGPATPTAVGPWPFINGSATPTITTAVVGAFGACAIDSGTVVCFGQDVAGDIGNGAGSGGTLPPTIAMTEGSSAQSSVPILPPSGANVLAIVPFGYTPCALQRGAAVVWCWGNNVYGQTGDTTRAEDSLAYPIGFPAMTSSNLPIQVVVGFEAACTLLANGSVYCWGFNGEGEYGNGTQAKSFPTHFTPTEAQVPVPLTTISLGGYTACGLDTQGTAWCWGATPGTGNQSVNSQPTPVTTPIAFTSLTTANIVCGLDALGTAYCWGDNGFGELGNGTQTTSTTPVRVAAPVTPGQPLGSAVVARVRAQRLRLASAARQRGVASRRGTASARQH